MGNDRNGIMIFIKNLGQWLTTSNICVFSKNRHWFRAPLSKWLVPPVIYIWNIDYYVWDSIGENYILIINHFLSGMHIQVGNCSWNIWLNQPVMGSLVLKRTCSHFGTDIYYSANLLNLFFARYRPNFGHGRCSVVMKICRYPHVSQTHCFFEALWCWGFLNLQNWVLYREPTCLVIYWDKHGWTKKHWDLYSLLVGMYIYIYIIIQYSLIVGIYTYVCIYIYMDHMDVMVYTYIYIYIINMFLWFVLE